MRVYSTRFNFFLTAVLILLCISFCSCISAFVSDSEPVVLGSELQKRRYVLVTDCFLARVGGSIELVRPGTCSGVPSSIQEYHEHGDDWWNQEEHSEYEGRCDIVGVVREGTTVSITALERIRRGLLAGYLRVWGRVGDPGLSQCKVRLGDAFNLATTQSDLRADPYYLVPLHASNVAPSGR